MSSATVILIGFLLTVGVGLAGFVGLLLEEFINE